MAIILDAEQIRAADRYTIENEPISSYDLMERAGRACFEKITVLFPNENSYTVVCGTGNNGGDGLVIARLLHETGKNISVYIVRFSKNQTPDFETTLNKLIETGVVPADIESSISFDGVSGIIIDALLGTGVSRPASGLLASVIKEINALNQPIISIDLPSGMFDSGNTKENRASAIKAHTTLTFQVPKLAFLMPENEAQMGDWHVLDIGLDLSFIDQDQKVFRTMEEESIKKTVRVRSPFTHKGTYGHAFIISGSLGKMGACILTSKACLRTGAGLVTAFVPKCGYDIIQSGVPEVMAICASNDDFIAGELKDVSTEQFSAIGIGPGIGTKDETATFLKQVLSKTNSPVVLDADALNIIAKDPGLWGLVPKSSIITPHPKEFERLFGKTSSRFKAIMLAQKNAIKKNIYVVLKGRYTAIHCPDGSVFFNTSGNPGMATAGSGDVLTGIITSLLAQQYSPKEASLLGVYLHGYSGDLVKERIGMEALIASDIIDEISNAFKSIYPE